MRSGLCIVGCILAASAEASANQATVLIPMLPSPVPSDGAELVAFEVVAGPPVTPSNIIELTVTSRDRTLVRFAGSDLRSRAAQDRAGGPLRKTRIYVELRRSELRDKDGVVATIGYRDAAGMRRLVASRRVWPDGTEPVSLAPPLAGGPWIAVHSPDWPRGHRRVVYAANARDRIPGRYAIDWVGVDADGRVTSGSADKPADAIGYGADVLAAANATVAAVSDGIPESASIKANQTPRRGQAAGNHVVLRIARNRYVFYEHLKPGSILVRKGQSVKAGQVIGALGFTGDSTGPHLHLHVADCAELLRCEGVPFVVRNMVELGRYRDAGLIGKSGWSIEGGRGRLSPEWPGSNVVVRFEGSKEPIEGTPHGVIS